MKDANKMGGGGSGRLESFGLELFRFVTICFSVISEGFRRCRRNGIEAILLSLIGILAVFLLTFADYAYLKALNRIWPEFLTGNAVVVLRTVPRWIHFVTVTACGFCSVLFFYGLPSFITRNRYQTSLNAVGLANALGVVPKVARALSLDEERTKLIVTARGIGLDRFESKRADLESSFGQIVERIDSSADRKSITILLCRKELQKLLPFEDIKQFLKTPYSFVVGESASGLVTQDIRELPHLLIAGTTGGGKSVFFRQVLVGLLESSPHLQMYLIDLKRGVEVKEFGLLPNVRIAKNELEAVQILAALKEEMYRRFAFMETEGIKKIDPEKHKRDLIVVGIDEASVLYGKTTVSKAKKELVAQARDLTDEIAKLARAAGIHLIIATQKSVKESLDTKTLENLPGRMVFKMSTHAGSNTALGNIRAYSLPDIKGRGIWAGGNKFIEIQAPFLSENDSEEECKSLAVRFEGQKDKNFQSMIEFAKAKSSATSGFNKNERQAEVA